MHWSVKESGRPVQETVASGALVGRLHHGGWKFRLGHAWALQQLARMEVSACFHFSSKNESSVANAPSGYQLISRPLAVTSASLLPVSKHSKLLPTMVPTFFNQSDINIYDPKLAHCKGSLFSVIRLSFPRLSFHTWSRGVCV